MLLNYLCSSVDIATGYGMDGRGSIPGRDKTFFALCSVRTGSEVNPAYYPIAGEVSFPRDKLAEESSWSLTSI
jgi:hypothetical protein